MILPIVAFGHPVLKKSAVPIEKDHEGLDQLIEDMWSTMYNADGVGLAAPQIGKSLRLFVIDTKQVLDDEDNQIGIKQAFLNATIHEESGKPWAYEEGCLSIPNVRADVERNEKIIIEYDTPTFERVKREFDGINARVIQHEYDHIEGKLFLDYIKPVKRRLIKRKLEAIKKGSVSVDYKMKFYTKK